MNTPVAALPATFVIVRHGQTEWNAAGRWQGWLDSPLTAIGRTQAKNAAELLQKITFNAAYSSDSGRAVDTALSILSRHHQIKLQTSPALRERFYGGYEGLSTDEIEERFPNTRYQAGRDNRNTWRPSGGGESLMEVRVRVEEFLNRVAQQHPGETVLMVTHSGVVRVIDSIASKEDLENIWDRAPANTCIFILHAWPDGRLEVARHFCQSEKPGIHQ